MLVSSGIMFLTYRLGRLVTPVYIRQPLRHRGGAKPIVELLLLPEELTPKLPNTLVKLFRGEADFC
jgi:hypothetical protein